MVRDPADVAVSQYFQWKFRMTDRKKTINDYPPAAAIGFEVMPDDPALPRMEIARWDGTYAERTRV